MVGAEPDALVVAVLRQQPVHKLLRGGADPNVRDQAGLTPLHHAVLAGNTDAVEALLDHAAKRTRPVRRPGGDPSQAVGSPWHLVTAPGPPPSRPSPLHLAAERSEHMLRVILGHSSLTSVGASFLGITISSKPQPELLQLRDARGWSLLHYAVSRANIPALRLLIQHLGSGPSDNYSSSSSSRSSSAGGAPHFDSRATGTYPNSAWGINAPDADGRTALHQAAILGHAECCRLLLKAGGDQAAVSAPPEGALPLHLAASGNHPAVIEILFRHAVAQHGFRAAQTVLLLANAVGLTALHVAALHDATDAARRLLHLVFPFDTRGPLGRTALHLAALKGSTRMISMLLGHSTPQQRQLRDAEGFTAVHLAAAAGRHEALRVLVTGGCSVNARAVETPVSPAGCSGWTPLHCAVRRGDVATIDLLVTELGADPYGRDEAGRTPCDLAVAVAKAGSAQGSIPDSSGPGTARSGHGPLDDMLWGPLLDGNIATAEECTGSGSTGHARTGSTAVVGSTAAVAAEPLQGPSVGFEPDGIGSGGGKMDEAQALVVLQAFIRLIHDPLRRRGALPPSVLAACGEGSPLRACGSSGTMNSTGEPVSLLDTRQPRRRSSVSDLLTAPAPGAAAAAAAPALRRPERLEILQALQQRGPEVPLAAAAAATIAARPSAEAPLPPVPAVGGLNGNVSQLAALVDKAAGHGSVVTGSWGDLAVSTLATKRLDEPVVGPRESLPDLGQGHATDGPLAATVGAAGGTGKEPLQQQPSASPAPDPQRPVAAAPAATAPRASPFGKGPTQRASPFQAPAALAANKPPAVVPGAARAAAGPGDRQAAVAAADAAVPPGPSLQVNAPAQAGAVAIPMAAPVRRSPFVATTKPSPFAAATRPSRLSQSPPQPAETVLTVQEAPADAAAAASPSHVTPHPPGAPADAASPNAGTPGAAQQQSPWATADVPPGSILPATAAAAPPTPGATPSAAALLSTSGDATPAGSLAVVSPINSPCGYSALNRAILLQRHMLAEALLSTLPLEGHAGGVLVVGGAVSGPAGRGNGSSLMSGAMLSHHSFHAAAVGLYSCMSLGLPLSPTHSKGLSPAQSQYPLAPTTSSGEMPDGASKPAAARQLGARASSVSAPLTSGPPVARSPPKQRPPQQHQRNLYHHAHLQGPGRPQHPHQPSVGTASDGSNLARTSHDGARAPAPPPLWPLGGPGGTITLGGAVPPTGPAVFPGLLIWDDVSAVFRTQPPNHTTRCWTHWPGELDPSAGWLVAEVVVVEAGAPGGHVWFGLGPPPELLATANVGNNTIGTSLAPGGSTAAGGMTAAAAGLALSAAQSSTSTTRTTTAPPTLSLSIAAPSTRGGGGLQAPPGVPTVSISLCQIINHSYTYVVCIRDGQAFRGGTPALDMGGVTRMEARNGDTIALFWNRRGRNAAYTLNGRYCGRLTGLPSQKRLTPILGSMSAGFVFKWRCCTSAVGPGGALHGGGPPPGDALGMVNLDVVGSNVDALMVREQMLHEDLETPWLCKPSMLSHHYASWVGNTRLLPQLIRDKGFSPDEPDGDGWTALHFAALAGQVETVRALLALDAHPDKKTKCGSTPILLAAKYGRSPDHVAIVRALADAGAALDVRDARGRTLLMFAAKAGNMAMVQLLLDRGLDPSATDCQDREPQQFAGQHGAIFRLLRAAQAAQRAGTRKRKARRKQAEDAAGAAAQATMAAAAAGGDSCAAATVNGAKAKGAEESETSSSSSSSGEDDGADGGATHGRDVDVQHLPLLADRWRVGVGQLIRGRLIEQGAFGAVFEGTWCGARVAIKQVLRRRLDSTGGEGGAGGGGGKAGNSGGGAMAEREVASLEREVAILAALPPHERIARMLGSVELPGEGVCLVMAFYPHTLQGVMQSERLRRSWLTPVRRAVIARQLAEGLAFLHGLPGPRVIHRDLKPNNVLLEAAPSLGVKICDFGLSRILAGSDVQSSSAAGHAFWMAPELLRALPYDEKVDVYSYGVILYQLAYWVDDQLYGGLNKAQVDFQVVHGMLRLQDRLPGGIDPGVQALVRDCLDENSRSRPSMAQVLERLAGHRELPQPGSVALAGTAADGGPATAASGGGLNRRSVQAPASPGVESEGLHGGNRQAAQ